MSEEETKTLVVNEETGEVLEEPTEEEEEAAGEEEPDEEEEPEAEAQPEPENPSLEAQQKVFDRANRKAESYAKGMIELLGELGGELHPCPRCGDFYPGFILPHAIKPVTEEQRVAVKVSMGEDPTPVYQQTEQAAVCSSCDGWGKVSTGSKVRGQLTATCPKCSGKGWTGSLQPASLPIVPAVLDGPEDVNGTDPGVSPDTDPWGRMKGDPLYGVMPGYEQ